MIAALALLVVIGDSNAVPWIIHEDLGYVQTLARQRPEPVEALPLPGAGFVRDAPRARHAIRTAPERERAPKGGGGDPREDGMDDIVLAMSTRTFQFRLRRLPDFTSSDGSFTRGNYEVRLESQIVFASTAWDAVWGGIGDAMIASAISNGARRGIRDAGARRDL